MLSLIRNQTDPAKKRFNNIVVRCGEHGWECPELKREAEKYQMERIYYSSMHCFHYHTSKGCNFNNFQEKLSHCKCELNYYPLPGGLRGTQARKNRRRNADNSRSRSRSNSRSPPPRQAATQRIINYQPDEAQRQAINDSRFASLEVGIRDFKKYKKSTDVKLKNFQDSLSRIERTWNRSNKDMQSVFGLLKKEDLQEDFANIQETESVQTFGRSASPAVDDHEPQLDHLSVNPLSFYLGGAQPRPQ